MYVGQERQEREFELVVENCPMEYVRYIRRISQLLDSVVR